MAKHSQEQGHSKGSLCEFCKLLSSVSSQSMLGRYKTVATINCSTYKHLTSLPSVLQLYYPLSMENMSKFL